jgi:hypothetical protein
VLGAVAPTLAVTVAGWLVVRIVEAAPSGPVVARVVESVPAVVVNETGEEGRAFPLMSNTFAVTVEVPPVFGTSAGLAFTETRPTPAVPTAILTAPPVVVVVVPPVEVLVPPAVVAPPDVALMTAVPLLGPERNLTITRPAGSVRASAGSMDPRVVVKETTVPLCGGVPAASRTFAMMSVSELTGRTLVDAVKVIVEPVGARRGTSSQAAAANASSPTAARTLRRRVIMKSLSILVP